MNFRNIHVVAFEEDYIVVVGNGISTLIVIWLLSGKNSNCNKRQFSQWRYLSEARGTLVHYSEASSCAALMHPEMSIPRH